MQSHRSPLFFHLRATDHLTKNMFNLKYLWWRWLFFQSLPRLAWKISDLRSSFWDPIQEIWFWMDFKIHLRSELRCNPNLTWIFGNMIEFLYTINFFVAQQLNDCCCWWFISFQFPASALTVILIHTTNIFEFRWHSFLPFKNCAQRSWSVFYNLHRNYFHMLERSPNPCFL